MADTDQQALQIITQHWGTDPEQQLGRITIALGEDEHLSEFVDALAGGEGIYIPERDLHAALALCERELPEEQIAVALGDTPGRGVLSPAEYLAWWAKKALQV